MIAPGPRTVRASISRFRKGALARRRDLVTVEEPLEIRVEWWQARQWVTRSVAVTMRTPGDDFELAAGFLFSEGLVTSPDQIQKIAYCGDDGPTEFNVVTVRLMKGVAFDPDLIDRNFYMTSSCGVCGKATLEAIEIREGCAFPKVESEGGGKEDLNVDSQVLASLPDRLRESQPVFDRTGGLHAAGLFRADGSLQLLREDVGRHNAVDKVVGRTFLAGELPLNHRIMIVSGRTSYEIMQKALAAGLPFVASVGAPSSLAVEVAQRFRMTLAGFVREGGFNIYSEPGRVKERGG